MAVQTARHAVAAGPEKQPTTHTGLVPPRSDQRQLPEAARADERRQRLPDVRPTVDARRYRRTVPRQQPDLHTSRRRYGRSVEPVTIDRRACLCVRSTPFSPLCTCSGRRLVTS